MLGFKSKWHFNTQISSLEDAERAIDYTFNPKGSRGLSPYTASFDYNHYSSDKKQKINKKIFLGLLIGAIWFRVLT